MFFFNLYILSIYFFISISLVSTFSISISSVSSFSISITLVTSFSISIFLVYSFSITISARSSLKTSFWTSLVFTALVRFLLNYIFLGLLGTADLVKATVIGQNSKLCTETSDWSRKCLFFIFFFS